jgi:FAD/FMN-containing dehydrogenase
MQVLAVGAMHSVNACMTNHGGTVLNMSSMNSILGLEPHGVRVQAGCKMADIYDFLAQHVSHQAAAAVVGWVWGWGWVPGWHSSPGRGGGGRVHWEGALLHSRSIRLEYSQVIIRVPAAGTSIATGLQILSEDVWE